MEYINICRNLSNDLSVQPVAVCYSVSGDKRRDNTPYNPKKKKSGVNFADLLKKEIEKK